MIAGRAAAVYSGLYATPDAVDERRLASGSDTARYRSPLVVDAMGRGATYLVPRGRRPVSADCGDILPSRLPMKGVCERPAARAGGVR